MKNMTQIQYKETISKLALEKIQYEPALQSRVKMSPNKVADYQKAYNNGTEFPPLLIAKQTNDEGLVRYRLLDGWHRCQALVNNRVNSKFKVPVRILEVPIDITLHTLRYLGGRENVKNGLGLTSKDKRVLFVNYVRGGFNKEGHSYKSYRTIASELSLVPHQTIARWMWEKFPAIAKLMSKDNGDVDELLSFDGSDSSGIRITDMPDLSSRERDIYATTLLEEAKASDNDFRGNIIQWAKELVEKLEREAPYVKPVPIIDPNNTDRF
jgi:hypothetical protein